MPPRTRLSYSLLALLRILIAFTSHSFIHPDEHFQNPEVAAGGVFDFERSGEGLLRTWEWKGEAPCRSIVPVWMSTGLSFAVLKVLTPRTLSSSYFRSLR
jgi:phosphatidylinositol glycan class Z